MNLGESSDVFGLETIVDGGSPVCSFMSSHSRYVYKTAGFGRLCFLFDLEEGWNDIQKCCDEVFFYFACGLNISSLQM